MTGRHHAISEFLAENVLDTLEPSMLDFLLATSITERICGDLAAALSGVPDRQAMLEQVEERDLFLHRLDEQWFRYHQLFIDFLRHRLDRDESRADRCGCTRGFDVVRRAPDGQRGGRSRARGR